MKALAAFVSILLLAMVALLVVSTIVDPERTVSDDAVVSVADPAEVFDPVDVGDPLPSGFRQLLARDAIFPVYDPKFVPAVEAGWSDDDLVIGLEIDGASKAYPVGFLNRREMVIDRLAGIPVLVTW